MLITPQKVLVTCTSNNKKYWENKGYTWNYHQKIEVDVNDLSKGSVVNVDVLCDYCLEKGKENIITKYYYSYNKQRKIISKDSCFECQSLKLKEVSLKLYGVDNPSKTKSAKAKISKKMENRKPKLDQIIEEFKDRKYQLISNEYKNYHSHLEYICLNHKDKGVQKISYANFTNNHGCKYCGRENTINAHIGDKSHFWNGGISPLANYLRKSLTEWKKKSIENCDYKCIVSGLIGDGSFEVHHIYPVSDIIQNISEKLNLPIYSTINQYTEKLT